MEVERDPGEPEHQLSDLDRAVLQNAGVSLAVLEDPALGAAIDARQRARLEDRIAGLVAESLTIDGYAQAVGIRVAAAREQVFDGSLWVFEHEGEQRVPGWALHDGLPLSGLDAVNRTISRSAHPVSVHGLVHTPNPDLWLDGNSVSVLTWLRRGGDPAAAAGAIGERLAT